ncbi:DUF2161 family putative PD-(D/E)XK-type phosphodiesterase [Clostridium folliculivorans]|uniref:Uncharacterized protein n=1 Tax=Clostridium folliculivorans TaxID=2886038 RepID=A0A9W5XYR1_9CLOT|nr:DUF2161 family putative PD-(D/E)XK-type phosphodiesterase [Clostridium folliculivorans]GKU23496.1 hypothetical protein CFOLD11_03220 [Clostridium folliculivorans]GKU29612.1 hypothetical protein CFB3_17190 [Clostridium folliculivorans]
MKKDFLLEEELYKPVREYLTSIGYDVKAEVGNCDVFAMKGDKVVVVELKKGLTIELLVQATNRQKFADLVYIAIPKPKINFFSKKWKDICNLIRRLQIGLILVSKKDNEYTVKINIEPAPFDIKKSVNSGKKKRNSLVKEFKGRSLEDNVGGSKGKKLMTAYREQSIKIAEYMMENGPTSAASLSKIGFEHKRTYSIIYNNYYGWFKKLDKGMYELSEEGVSEIRNREKLKIV